ncbi:MAG: hypothetical protein ACD_28C00204G0005 [uncultured bacterium]|nr:MAG: hypothetical protein ACD_28C00204G0005 [uncultured bacterium]KKT74982.1 MAG: hypothetical protein UW70_C0041G0005 [Candidatus Peregrinibacteria bacterium GW2011_GWA2_44_7]
MRKKSLKEAIIVDLDGTLANVDHRLHHLQSQTKDWAAFFAAMGEDKPQAWCAFITQHLPVEVILMSGRPGEYEEETKQWLQVNQIKYDRLIMRARGDFRKDDIVKKELYERDVKGKYEVLFVIDDRKQVVDMWRSIGLVCLQCAPGDF